MKKHFIQYRFPVLAMLLVCASQYFLVNAATPQKKATAEYCQACGCKNIIYTNSMDNKPTSFLVRNSTDNVIIDDGVDANVGGKCSKFETDNSGLYQYGVLALPSNTVTNMNGKICRVSGYYKTDGGRLFDMYGRYWVTGDNSTHALNYGYVYGSPLGWQKFEYYFDFEAIHNLSAVQFLVRSPDNNTYVYIDNIEICTYTKDETNNIAVLSNLTFAAGASPVTLLPSFESFATGYTAKVISNDPSITITATPKVVGSSITMKYNGTVIATSGTGTATLAAGLNNYVTIEVTKSNYIPMQYTVQVQKGTDPALSDLALFQGVDVAVPLSPLPLENIATTTHFEASVLADISSVNVMPTALDNASTITINGTITVVSGAHSIPITLETGTNDIKIQTTAPSGGKTANYSITVNRGVDTRLKTLVINDPSANPIPYTPVVSWPVIATTYNFNVNNLDPTIPSVNLIAQANDPNAIMCFAINKSVVPNPISIPFGKTDIEIIISSPDKLRSNSYWVTFTKGMDASLASLDFKIAGVPVPSSDITERAGGHYYDINYNPSVSQIAITPTTSDIGATLEIKIGDQITGIPSGQAVNITLSATQPKSVTFFVTARDGTIEEYDVQLWPETIAATPAIISFNTAASSASGPSSLPQPKISVSIRAASAADLVKTVNYTATGTGGTATGGGVDYTLANGTLNFDAINTTATIPLTVVANPFPHGVNEIVNITLFNPSNGAILGTPSTFAYTINEVNPVLTPTLYVQSNITTSGSGSSWGDGKAFKYLQDALTAARNSGGGVTEIRVAAGTYYPDETASNPTGAPHPRTATFALVSNVNMIGGYPANGGQSSDPITNETILSGDLLKNDGNNFANYGENAYTVVTGNNNAIIDGFTIAHGCANDYYGGNNEGAGMLNFTVSPTIENCTFLDNYAYFHEDQGGGSGHYAGAGAGILNDYASPVIINCDFIGNYSAAGGGICNFDGSSPSVSNCYFYGNQGISGGGINNENSSPSILSCVFIANVGSQGGAIKNYYHSSPLILNCTMTQNVADIFWGGALLNYYDANTEIVNCIIWDNQDEISNNVESIPIISYSDIRNSGGSGNWNANFGTDAGNNIDADPVFTTNYYLGSTSPCIDVGNDTRAPTFDKDHNSRVDIAGKGNAGTLSDFGAYEYRP
ncbi:MAG: cadherin-like beta sandwich domain-containing protein [Chitinivibrionales bacterium]|nr:cadherin-like beta sandwich domain-containing protein [Chitinivibrionales bacterium]